MDTIDNQYNKYTASFFICLGVLARPCQLSINPLSVLLSFLWWCYPAILFEPEKNNRLNLKANLNF